ncbi:hypothetical protein AAVH_36056, partial [Aphelenchoides avenae]
SNQQHLLHKDEAGPLKVSPPLCSFAHRTRTALVADDEVELLKKNKCALISTREKPHLLIGHDLFHLFERRFRPQLPSGFHVTWTCLGPVAGRAGKVANTRKAATNTRAAASSDPEPPSDTATKPTSTSDQPTQPQHLG